MNKSGFGWRGASLLAMLALVSTVAHAQEPSVSENSGLRVFLVGTSATGHSKALHDIAEGHGYTTAKTKHALMGGASLGWLMTYMKPELKNDLATNKWDALSLQVTSPMPACMQYGAGFKKGGGFAQLAYEGNPECQIYLFGGGLHPRFPTYMPGNWGVQDRLTRILEQGEAKGLSYQGRVEAIADEFTALFPHRKPCLIIPMEEVLVELHKRIQKGEVPEYTHLFDMHDGHWNYHKS